LGRSPATVNQAIAGLRFLFGTTLKRPDVMQDIRNVCRNHGCPAVPSGRELEQLLSGTTNSAASPWGESREPPRRFVLTDVRHPSCGRPESALRHLLLLGIVVGSLVLTVRAEAQSEAYERAIEEALREYAGGHYEEARELFLSAHRERPNARTLRGLGMTEFELRHYPEAVSFLEQALGSNEKPLGGELRARTEDLLAHTRTFVGRVRLLVQPNGASLEVDGEATALTDELALGVGRHVLTVRAEGREQESRTLTLRGGQEQTVTISLAPTVTVEDGPVAAPGDDRSQKRRRRWIWSTVGVAVAAGVGTALVIALRPEARTRSDEGDFGFIARALGDAR
jgi:hypothetical protein